MCLFQFSTCFEQPRAHHQENQLYRYNIWYVSIWPSSMQVGKFLPDLHTRRSPTQSDIYQMLYWYNWFSWLWAWGCSKHVENWNKCIEKRTVHQVGHLQELYWDSRSTEHTSFIRLQHLLPRIISKPSKQCWCSPASLVCTPTMLILMTVRNYNSHGGVSFSGIMCFPSLGKSVT
jgi:hypothetical protein